MSQQRIQNLYIAKLTTTERPCYVCSKFTAVVLTLADNSNLDWFYVCRSHLGDTNFCTRIGGGPASKSVPSSPRKKNFEESPPVSDSVSDLVASIGSAWNNWRKKDDGKDKKENEDDKKNEKVEDDKSTNKEKGEEKEGNQQEEPTSPKSPQQPVRFILQKDYYYMRQREYARKIQKKEANDRLKTLQFPEVPKTRPQ